MYDFLMNTLYKGLSRFYFTLLSMTGARKTQDRPFQHENPLLTLTQAAKRSFLFLIGLIAIFSATLDMNFWKILNESAPSPNNFLLFNCIKLEEISFQYSLLFDLKSSSLFICTITV